MNEGRWTRSLFAWPALVVAGSIPLSYWLQLQAPDQESLWRSYGLIPAEVMEGDWSGLFTSLMIHGSWPHAIVNGALALIFAAFASRPFGGYAGRASTLFIFYLVCGLIAGVAYVASNPDADTVVIGASGAVSGLFGAALRCWKWRERGLLPFWAAPVVIGSALFGVVNFLLAFQASADADPGAIVAWQEHIAGFLAGLLLIGPWSRVFGVRRASALSVQTPEPAEPAAPPEAVPEPSAGETVILEDAPN